MITANVIYRVFRLKVGPETGTGFTVEDEGGQYLVTVRHLAIRRRRQVKEWLASRVVSTPYRTRAGFYLL